MKYLELKKSGKLAKIIEQLDSMLEKCSICPRNCGINRKKEKSGHCRSGYKPVVSSHNLHFGEEPPISGTRGSGTIFLTNCSLSCCFCQNYPISQLENGNEVTIEELSGMMISLQEKGAHNINFVTPTHFVPQIVKALGLAIEKGLKIPLVYNSSGYDSVSILKLIEGIVDIYMPDSKYADNNNSKKYSNVPDYPSINRKALVEMHRQSGNLRMDKKGVAQKGLIIRHLALPENIAGSKEVLEFIAENISKGTYISIMAQYHPAYKSVDLPELARKVSPEEYAAVLNTAEELGLENGWHQEIN